MVVLGETEGILVECKLTSKSLGVDILADLERKAGLMWLELEDRRIQFVLCSRSGFTTHHIESAEQREDIMLLGLPEIVD